MKRGLEVEESVQARYLDQLRELFRRCGKGQTLQFGSGALLRGNEQRKTDRAKERELGHVDDDLGNVGGEGIGEITEKLGCASHIEFTAKEQTNDPFLDEHLDIQLVLSSHLPAFRTDPAKTPQIQVNTRPMEIARGVSASESLGLCVLILRLEAADNERSGSGFHSRDHRNVRAG